MRIIRGIADSGLVPDDELDLLPDAFLAAGRNIYWEPPADWFDGPEIVIELDSNADPGSPATVDLDKAADPPAAVVAREVRPPLRRWATQRVVRADPTTWASVLLRSKELDARSRAAVMRGLLDALDGLPPEAQQYLFGIAAVWTHHDVRRAAVDLTATDHRRKTTISSRDEPTDGPDHNPTRSRMPDATHRQPSGPVLTVAQNHQKSRDVSATTRPRYIDGKEAHQRHQPGPVLE